MTFLREFLLILFLSFKVAFSVKAGDKVCFDGYIMDRYCLDRTTLFDNHQIKSLEQPDVHSVHCLVDVKQCVKSGFEMLSLEILKDGKHGRAFRIDSGDDSKIIEFVREKGEKGRCTTCTGPAGGITQGFKAVIQGEVKHEASSNRPAIIAMESIADSGTICPSGYFIQPDVYFFESNKIALIYAHASMMIIGWGTLLPLGVIVAKLGRHRPNGLWFKIHRPLQIIGLCFALAGWIIALTQFTALDHGSGDQALHARLGMFVMCAGLFQPLNAFIRPHVAEDVEKKPTKRLVWEIIHKSLGYLSVLLAIVVISFGTMILPRVDDRKRFQMGYGLGSGLVLVLTIIFLVFDKTRFQQPPSAVNQDTSHSVEIENQAAENRHVDES